MLVPRGNAREVTDKCNGCGVCVKAFGCPAIALSHERAEIDPTLCYGCGVCQTVCPFEAIKETEK